MIKNILKIVFRNMWRYKGYTALNITGIAIGIAAMVWGFLTYSYSFSFDNFHPDRENVYRAFTYREGSGNINGIFPMPAVIQSKAEFAGIEEAVRWESRGLNVKYGDNEPFAESVNYTDPEFFKIFHFPLVAGSYDISNKNSVLITEAVAKKYFGKQDPLGKSLVFYSGDEYALPLTVTGVLKNVPNNSSLWFGFLTHFDNYRKADGKKIEPDDWSWMLDAAFFKIKNTEAAAAVEKSFNKYLSIQNEARKDWKVSGFQFYSLKKAAQLSEISSNNLIERPEDSAAYGTFILALLIFISACLNFSNTTISSANRRLKEIGMRKVMGGSQKNLVLQLLMECGLIVLFACLLSVLLNQFWLPYFNSMFSGIKLTADYLNNSSLLVFIFVLILITTLLAGAYPAFYVSRFNPSTIFRGSVKFGGRNLFSKIMLGLQLSIALITVIAGFGFSRNATFQKNYDYGYNIENTIGLVVTDTTRFNAIRNEMAAIPQVTGLAGTRNHIGHNYRNVVAEAEEKKSQVNFLEVGDDYLQTMNLKMAQGRAFDKAFETDYTSSIIITQNIAANYGWKEKEALGKRIFIDSVYYSVVGVLRDFHLDNLFQPLEPVVMKLAKENRYQYLIVQAKATDLQMVFEKTKQAWKKIFPLKPFNGFYQNELKAEAYKVTSSIAEIFFWFAIISVLLTATGLFALVSLTVVKKMKEIAVRKVVGAKPEHIMMLINKGYFWVFIIGAVLGCYGGYSLTGLLLNLIFKVNAGIAVSSVVSSLFVLFIIIGITSGIKVWQAVRTNPVKLLRTE